MTYFRHDKQTNEITEISYDQALKIVLGTFKDCDMTRDMLTIANRIDCIYSYVIVQNDEGMVLQAGLYNFVPTEYFYDDDGWRYNPL